MTNADDDPSTAPAMSDSDPEGRETSDIQAPGQEILPAQVPVDPILASFIEPSRDAVVEVAGTEAVGEHVRVDSEGPFGATHHFAATHPGYRGWLWSVTIARIPDESRPTICEVVMLPGPDALVAPEWRPWDTLVRPGDLGAGDVLPTGPDDYRLVPGYTGEDDDDPYSDTSEVAWELGLGRPRVLSPAGRAMAARRWEKGETGPTSAMARAAGLACSGCGFLVRLGGPLRQQFGACANEMSPSDGMVVSMDFGCGAHSETPPEPVNVPVVPMLVDDFDGQGLETLPSSIALGPAEPEPVGSGPADSSPEASPIEPVSAELSPEEDS